MSIRDIIYRYLVDHYPRIIIDHRWKKDYGYHIDWKNPRDLNEKIQWLICYGDTSQWPMLADKYLVRDYVKSKGYVSNLVKLYAVYDKAEQIDFDSLPEKSILKCTHDSGSYVIINKQKGYDRERIIQYLRAHLRNKFGYLTCEPHYNKIKPRIIAEEFLCSNEHSFSTSLIDYKVWCFNGKPYCIWACYSRDKEKTFVNVYDLEWNVHPEYSIFTNHYQDGEGRVPKPKALDTMLKMASDLSKDLPQSRIDFYIVDDHVYFGEITLTSNTGRMDFYSKDFLVELGNQVKLVRR